MHTQLNCKFNNTYHVKLINAKTKEIRKEGEFKNIYTQNIANNLVGSFHYGMLFGLRCGAGTTTPSFNDTNLSSQLWQIFNSNVSADNTNASKVTYEWLDDYTCRATRTFIFPATSSYTGTVTEVGLMSGYYRKSDSITDTGALVTRALLTDSEGQPISFNKTDLDILEIGVTVEGTLSSADGDFHVYKHPELLSTFIIGVTKANANITYKYSGLYLTRYHKDCISTLGASVGDLSTGCTRTGDTSNKNAPYVNYDSVRIPSTTITSQRYYFNANISGLGYWPLPNESIFPAYNITAIPIGTGNGATTQFNNPLNYFKADTDKVYKNGVLLTRGVDYTINNMSNVDYLPEIAQFIIPSKVTCDLELISTAREFHPLFEVTHRYYNPNELKESNMVGAFNSSNPIYVEFENEVTLNYLRAEQLRYSANTDSGYTYAVPSGVTFYIETSTDGVEYNTITSHTTVDSTGSFIVDFADTTSKYWRVRTDSSAGRIFALYTRTAGSSRFIQFGKRDPYIEFTTPPAEGDILTMDADMDVIMKNDKFVIDITARFTFNL